MGSGSHSSKHKKKRSQKHNKKRSIIRKEKSKKLKRPHDSVSSGDEDSASNSSLSCSSCSSEDDHRSKKRARSRDRRDRKGHKKRTKKSSYIGKSSRESPDRKGRKKRTKRGSLISKSSGESPRLKKREKSRGKDSGLRKKKHRKNKKREPIISSSSDRSRSHSTCEESELERKEEKLEIERKGRELVRKRSASAGKSRHSSRSCSPCSVSSGSHDNHGEERTMEGYHPKRLKSVIVAKIEREEPEVGHLDKDGHKDEIVYEHDDYPSRSNDSYDGMSGRDAVAYSDDASFEAKRLLDVPNRESVTFDVGASELSANQRLEVETSGKITSSSVGSRVDVLLKGDGNDASTVSTGSIPNLESTLRQKALENLLKRQGKLPASMPADNKDNRRNELKSSSSYIKSVLLKPDEVGSVRSVLKVVKDDGVKQATNASGGPNNNDVHHQCRNLETSHSAENCNASDGHMLSVPKIGLSTSTRRPLGTSNTWKRVLTTKDSFQLDRSMSKEAGNQDSAKVLKFPPDIKLVDEKVNNSATSEPSPSGEKNVAEQTNEDDEDSEFQQKTMSVMRGGEMVQVSYKVKIPKKVPALARRQLKR